MINKIKRVFNLISNMGIRYLFFRISYLIKTKLGWQKVVFPVKPKDVGIISLKEWKESNLPFFFQGKDIVGLKKVTSKKLENKVHKFKNGVLTYFNHLEVSIGKNYDWLVNPSTGYKYDINKHWSEIEDLSNESGDIKYVWEKARFSFLYDLIRYDFHYEKDQSDIVFREIESFIDNNPINQGPNYKCSQEISLRVLNWTFALFYYKESKNLSNDLFKKIIQSIYWHIHHVYHNINFSRIAVRNNHAITETLTLYLAGKLFPFFPNVDKWSKKGKKWFEKEVEYQIYKDGTFLQFSMNYHRVVVQLLTWGIRLSEMYNDPFKETVYDRAKKSLIFLETCMDPISGRLPNYGSNDGALFFKFTDDDYRIYKSQLDDLRAVLYQKTYYESRSAFWYGVQPINVKAPDLFEINSFDKGGYYICQEGNVKTFIRCGKYKDRPYQSDNLHIDLWVDGENILRDNGSYKYNTKAEYLKYFNGSEAHNTFTIKGYDQMLKGGRFIWYYWVKKAKGSLEKKKDFIFDGEIEAYKHLSNNIRQKRIVRKKVNQRIWIVKDSIENKGDNYACQYWHIAHKHKENLEISCLDSNSNAITPVIEEVWCSSYYGVKERSLRYTFETKLNSLITTIKINENITDTSSLS